ncbi:hypothetical protein E4T25_04330 [Photobacterium damselae subsp. piscicida]|nr:hypothetical protein E4T25_04330 [Photobacterium damselae subsp. piscicida]
MTDLVLTLVVVGVILATTVPFLLNRLTLEQQQTDIDQAIALTLERLQQQVITRINQCALSRAVTVSDLNLPEPTRHTLPHLRVFVEKNGNIISNVALTFTLTSEAKAQRINQGMRLTNVWGVRHGKELTITQPVTYLDSQLKRMYYDVATGCFQ